MKLLTPLLYYLLFFIIFILGLFLISMGSITKTLGYFTDFYIYFNIIFITIFYYLFNNLSKLSISFVAITALLLTLLLCEVIYPNILKENIILKKTISEQTVIKEDITIENIELDDPISDLEFAKSYLNEKEFSTAWYYADKISEIYPLESENIKKLAKEGLNTKVFIKDNPKYIETLKYKKLVSQKKYLEAYYFCLDKINNTIYDNDFNIKLNDCFTILRNDYYSINYVDEILTNSGYSDIQFFDISDGLKLYNIDKLVEYNGEYFLQNVKVNSSLYPYIYINKKGKVFSKGFDENREFTYIFEDVKLPINPENLKLFSKEMYKLSASSLNFNIRVYSLKTIRYFKESHLSNLIISRLVNYSSILIIFFLVFSISNKQNFLNFIFINSLVIFSLRWFIKQIGLIFLNSSLGLSFIIVSILYSITFIHLIKKEIV